MLQCNSTCVPPIVARLSCTFASCQPHLQRLAAKLSVTLSRSFEEASADRASIREISGSPLSRGLAWLARVHGSKLTVALLFTDGRFPQRLPHDSFFPTSLFDCPWESTFRHGSDASALLVVRPVVWLQHDSDHGYSRCLGTFTRQDHYDGSEDTFYAAEYEGTAAIHGDIIYHSQLICSCNR